MVDVWLIVISAIVPAVLLALNVLIMAKYIDREASEGHYIGKLFWIVAFLVPECTVLLLPLDVGNRSGVVGCGYWNSDCGGLDLASVWEAVYIIVVVLVVAVMPFAICYYESDDEGMSTGEAPAGAGCLAKTCKRTCMTALMYTCVSVVVALLVVLITWAFFAKTYIPYKLAAVDVATAAYFNASQPFFANQTCGAKTCTFVDGVLEFDVTFIVYMAGLFTWAGWFLFMVYGGIGLVAIPLDLVNAFLNRPVLLSSSVVLNRRANIRKQAENLIAYGTSLGNEISDYTKDARKTTWRERRERKQSNGLAVNRMRVLVQQLEADYEQLELSDPKNWGSKYNPLVPYFKLLGGIVGALVSVLWVVHIFVYMLASPPLTSFLNEYFTFFDQYFAFIGTLSIGLFSMYLLFAVVKGNFKCGSRLFCIKIHPMELGKTMLNAFYFNLALVLLCVLPVVQFCTEAFAEYSRMTDASQLFGSQIKYMGFFRYMFQSNFFIWFLIAIIFVSCIYFFRYPSEKQYLKDVMAGIARSSGASREAMGRKIDARGGALVSASDSAAIELTRGRKRTAAPTFD